MEHKNKSRWKRKRKGEHKKMKLMTRSEMCMGPVQLNVRIDVQYNSCIKVRLL
jgi:hypothetical protein